jgi:HSP20 family molecular chaperone IbpA
MKINPESLAAKDAKYFSRTQKNLIDDRERKLRTMDHYYDQKELAMKDIRGKQLDDINQRNLDDVAKRLKEIDADQNRFQGRRQQIDKEMEQLEVERQKLMKANEDKTIELRRIQSEKESGIFDRASEDIRNIQEKSNDRITRENVRAEMEVSRQKAKIDNKLSAQGKTNEDYIYQKENEYSKERERVGRDQMQIIKKNEDDLKKALEQQKSTFLRNSETYRSQFQSNLKTQQEQEKLMTEQNKQTFQKEVEKKSVEYNQVLGRMEQQLKTDMKNLIASHVKKRDNIQEKINDPFYQIREIDPSIDESEAGVIVSVRIPEHEKESVMMSVDKRNLRMTMARRFNDQLVSEDGSVIRSGRSETLSKEWKVKDILNPKTIQQKYENGVLSFIIKKA